MRPFFNFQEKVPDLSFLILFGRLDGQQLFECFFRLQRETDLEPFGLSLQTLQYKSSNVSVWL